MVLRNSALLSPSTMRPLRSTTVTSPASRYVARSTAIIYLRSFFRPIARTLPIYAGSSWRQLLGHDDLRPAGAPRHHFKFVHERAHQKNSAAGGTQQVLLRQR